MLETREKGQTKYRPYVDNLGELFEEKNLANSNFDRERAKAREKSMKDC